MSISTLPSDMVDASFRAPRSDRGRPVRDLSVIASPGWIPLLVAGLATRFQQSDTAGVDALERCAVHDSAVAGGGVAGTVERPPRVISLLDWIEWRMMLRCAVFSDLL